MKRKWGDFFFIFYFVQSKKYREGEKNTWDLHKVFSPIQENMRAWERTTKTNTNRKNLRILARELELRENTGEENDEEFHYELTYLFTLRYIYIYGAISTRAIITW